MDISQEHTHCAGSSLLIISHQGESHKGTERILGVEKASEVTTF